MKSTDMEIAVYLNESLNFNLKYNSHLEAQRSKHRMTCDTRLVNFQNRCFFAQHVAKGTLRHKKPTNQPKPMLTPHFPEKSAVKFYTPIQYYFNKIFLKPILV